MVAGISTASYYPEVPEFALKRMAVLGVKAAEVFINAPSELEKPYLRELRRIADRGGVRSCFFPHMNGVIRMVWSFTKNFLRRQIC